MEPLTAPYFGSLGWWRRYARHLSDPHNTPWPSPCAEIRRTVLPGGLVLSIPVTGGSGAVKRLPAAQLEISQHGNWQHTHLGALEATYGRTPYYRHIEPHLTNLLREASGNLSLLNRKLLEAVKTFLDLETELEQLKEMRRDRPELLVAMQTEITGNADETESFLTLVCTHGRRAIFSLGNALIG